ncbi:MAG: hypothetical protein ACXAEN_12310 [Candidatus Thorarchaeota archaeon]|jgi:DNA-binding NtrC family response regulator
MSSLKDGGKKLRLLELFANVEQHRTEHENWFETVERLMLEYLVFEEEIAQIEMADILHVSTRVLNYKLGKYRLRPLDIKERKPKLKVISGGG